MDLRVIVGLIVGLVPVVIFGRLLPVLLPLFILAASAIALWRWVSNTIEQRRNAREWSQFSQDLAWEVTTSANRDPETAHDAEGREIWVGSIRLDLKRGLVAFDVRAGAAPICVRGGAIQEIQLVDLSRHPSAHQLDRLFAVGVRLKGERVEARYYTNSAHQIVQAIDGMRSKHSGSHTPITA